LSQAGAEVSLRYRIDRTGKGNGKEKKWEGGTREEASANKKERVEVVGSTLVQIPPIKLVAGAMSVPV